MRRRRQFKRIVIRPEQRVIKRGLARLGLGQRGFTLEQLATLGEISGREQTFDRDRNKITVGHVTATVRKGESAGITDQTPSLGTLGAERRQIILLQRAEGLPDRDGAGGWWSHAANLMGTI